MRRFTILFVTLPFALLGACFSTEPHDDNMPDASDGLEDESPCGEETLAGYLTESLCPAMAGSPRLPDHESADGYPCFLDILFYSEAPEVGQPPDCDTPPFTSSCFLEEVGLVDRAYDGLQGNVRVVLKGDWEETTICESSNVCHRVGVFRPCEAERIR